MSSTSIDNPFCQDENYPALIHNYFPPSVSISNRRYNKLIYTACIFSPAVRIRLIISFLTDIYRKIPGFFEKLMYILHTEFMYLIVVAFSAAVRHSEGGCFMISTAWKMQLGEEVKR